MRQVIWYNLSPKRARPSPKYVLVMDVLTCTTPVSTAVLRTDEAPYRPAAAAHGKHPAHYTRTPGLIAACLKQAAANNCSWAQLGKKPTTGNSRLPSPSNQCTCALCCYQPTFCKPACVLLPPTLHCTVVQHGLLRRLPLSVVSTTCSFCLESQRRCLCPCSYACWAWLVCMQPVRDLHCRNFGTGCFGAQLLRWYRNLRCSRLHSCLFVQTINEVNNPSCN